MKAKEAVDTLRTRPLPNIPKSTTYQPAPQQANGIPSAMRTGGAPIADSTESAGAKKVVWGAAN